jgi:DNA invertase Pin-like site-specific DNA recombinase
VNKSTPKDAGPEPSLRAAIYSRVSTDDQAREGYSLGEQDRQGQALTQREKWMYVRTYVDPGVSGSLRSRPALDHLIEDIAAGLIDVVIVAALDRLSRDAGHLRELLLIFDAAGVRVVASGQALDRATPEGRLQTGILGEFGQYEREKIKARAKSGIAGYVRSGKPWGSEAPYGYAKTRDEERWAPVDRERDVVRRIYRAFTEEGQSASGIARTLTKEGIRPRRGKHWSPTVISKILKGRYYLGEYRHGDAWLAGKHAPFINEDEWLSAQAEAERRAKSTPSGGRGRIPTRHLFVRGALRCGLCGEAMLPRSDARKGGTTDTYVCRTRKVSGVDACSMPIAYRAEIDQQALLIFASEELDYVRTRARVAAQLNEHGSLIQAEVRRADEELASLEAQQARVERDYRRGKLSAESHDRHMEAITEERKAAEAETARLRARAAEVEDAGRALDADEALRERFETLHRSVSAAALTASQIAEAAGDIGALRAAFGRVYSRADAHLHTDGRIGVLLEMRGDLIATLIEFPVPAAANNLSASGVPE